MYRIFTVFKNILANTDLYISIDVDQNNPCSNYKASTLGVTHTQEEQEEEEKKTKKMNKKMTNKNKRKK